MADIQFNALGVLPLVSVTDADIDVMARTIWGESRGEPLLGQVAVGWIIVNRVLAAAKDKAHFGWWGTTVPTVCLAKAQFSCWLPDDPNASKLRAATLQQTSFQRAFGVACLVLSGDIADPTDGATHYFADSIAAPSWTFTMQPKAKIGAHSFYREPSWS